MEHNTCGVGRVVDYTSLENWHTERYLGFESLTPRHRRNSIYYRVVFYSKQLRIFYRLLLFPCEELCSSLGAL